MGNAIEYKKLSADERVKAFKRTLGNPRTCLARLKDEVELVREHGNTVPLARFIDESKAWGDPQVSTYIRKIVGKVWVGAEVTNKTAKQPTNIRIRNAALSNSAVTALDEAVAKKQSIRGKELWAALNKDEPAPEPKPDYDVTFRAAKSVLSNNIDLDDDKAVKLYKVALKEARKALIEQAKKKAA